MMSSGYNEIMFYIHMIFIMRHKTQNYKMDKSRTPEKMTDPLLIMVRI